MDIMESLIDTAYIGALLIGLYWILYTGLVFLTSLAKGFMNRDEQ